MKSAVAFLLSLATVSAFAPASVSRPASQIQAAMDDMEGSYDFRGAEFKFDPVRANW